MVYEIKKLGRPKGWKMSDAQRKGMSERMKARWVLQKAKEVSEKELGQKVEA